MKKVLSHPLFSGSVLMVGGSLVINAVNYIYHLVMGRILGPVEYGILASIFSLLYMASIVPVSSSFAIVKFVAEAKKLGERQRVYVGVRKFIFKIALGGMIFLMLSSPLTAAFLHIRDVFSVLLVGPIFFLSLVILVDQAAMQGILKFIGVVGPNFISALGKLIIGLALVLAGYSVRGAISGVLLSLIFTFWVTKKLLDGSFKVSTVGGFKIDDFLKFALPVLVQALAFTAIFTVDLILVKHFLPAREAGLYAALSTLGKIIFFATQPIAGAMFPLVSGRRARGEKYKGVFWVAFGVTVLTTALIVGVYYFFPRLAIGILYGEAYLSVAAELVWMGIFIGLYSLCNLIVNFLLSVSRIKIVILPLLAVLVQIVAIVIWHGSILQVIQVSLAAMLALLASLGVYLGWQWRKSNYSLL